MVGNGDILLFDWVVELITSAMDGNTWINFAWN